MTPRHVLLRQPHMAHLLDHPALTVMHDAEIAALERFMGFCGQHSLDDPGGADLAAFAQLQDQTPDALEALSTALRALDVPGDFLAEIRETAGLVRHRETFRGVPKDLNRSYERSVTVPPCDLPRDWQDTLRRLHIKGQFAEAILDRMTRRLGAFAWSAARAGLAVDIGCIAAQKALYRDMRARSAAKNDGVPRWAYLRSTWEELARFARCHGCADEICDHLAADYDELCTLESLQDAKKLSKAMQTGTASGLLAEARRLLEASEQVSSAPLRHARRNRAAAIALGVAIPARPADVFEKHHFGMGIFFDPHRGAYRFRYTPKKTRRRTARPLNIALKPYWNRFIDALILQDLDPKYLGELRAQAFAKNRPLYVNFDGSHCAYPWYSHQWKVVTGTGGQIARTLIWDQMADHGAFGIEYASRANHHGIAMRRKYSTEVTTRAAYDQAQEIMIGLGPLEDDISDLL